MRGGVRKRRKRGLGRKVFADLGGGRGQGGPPFPRQVKGRRRDPVSVSTETITKNKEEKCRLQWEKKKGLPVIPA